MTWFKRAFLFFILLTKSAKFLKILQLAKFGKVFLTFGSMLISAIVYAFFLGPWFAIGFVILLFIHEMGHIIALRIKGHETSGPVFIPMLGAVIWSPKFKDPEEEAFVGYGGPLVGGLAAIALFGFWYFFYQSSSTLLMLSYFAVFLNLFNLIPIRPLDGGRITQAVGGWFKYIGMAALAALVAYTKDPLLVFIFFMTLADDDIKLDPWLKFGTGIVLQIMYVILMLTSIKLSIAWTIVLVLYFGLFGFFNIGLYFRARNQEDLEKSKKRLEKDLLELRKKMESDRDRDFHPVYQDRINRIQTKLKSDEFKDLEVKAEIKLPIQHRVKWFLLYLALAAVLAYFMFLQSPLVHELIKKPSQ